MESTCVSTRTQTNLHTAMVDVHVAIVHTDATRPSEQKHVSERRVGNNLEMTYLTCGTRN